MDISKLLTFSAKEGASDCHISAGEPPMIRLHGDLKKLDHPPLTAEETHALVYDMMSDAQRKNFEEKRECDFSFELGDIARFRVNVFVQNRGLGAVFRNIPTEIIPMEKLGLPASRPPALRQGKGPDPRDRSDRLRQVHNARLDGGLPEQHLRRPHHHHRRPDRVRS